MKYTCIQGDCWDGIALKIFQNEMIYPQLLEVNRQYSDVLMFKGGEVLEIPDQMIVDELFITRPYQSNAISIISAPWQ